MSDWSSLPGIVNTENWVAGLPDPVRLAIHERMVTKTYSPGDVLRAVGDQPNGFYQLESGYLRVIGYHPDGTQTLVLIYRPGNCMAESTIIAKRPSNHTTIAMTEARVRYMTMDDFWALYHLHREIPEALCRKFAGNMTRLLTRRELAATRRLRDMVAFVFCNLGEECGRREVDGAITIDMPLTQNDVADHLGVTRQAVQREIGALKKFGIVDKRDGHWRVLDAPALRRMAVSN